MLVGLDRCMAGSGGSAACADSDCAVAVAVVRNRCKAGEPNCCGADE
jgi:hypothetical protein